jgi:hypothetical protein
MANEATSTGCRWHIFMIHLPYFATGIMLVMSRTNPTDGSGAEDATGAVIRILWQDLLSIKEI